MAQGGTPRPSERSQRALHRPYARAVTTRERPYLSERSRHEFESRRRRRRPLARRSLPRADLGERRLTCFFRRGRGGAPRRCGTSRSRPSTGASGGSARAWEDRGGKYVYFPHKRLFVVRVSKRRCARVRRSRPRTRPRARRPSTSCRSRATVCTCGLSSCAAREAVSRALFGHREALEDTQAAFCLLRGCIFSGTRQAPRAVRQGSRRVSLSLSLSPDSKM